MEVRSTWTSQNFITRSIQVLICAVTAIWTAQVCTQWRNWIIPVHSPIILALFPIPGQAYYFKNYA